MIKKGCASETLQSYSGRAGRSKLQSLNSQGSTVGLIDCDKREPLFLCVSKEELAIYFNLGCELPPLSSIFRNMHYYLSCLFNMHNLATSLLKL